MIDNKNPIKIKDFNKGIADSPLNGFADMRNVNIDTLKGVAKTGNSVLPYIPPHFADQTFTADAGTDILTFADHNYDFDSNDSSVGGTGQPIRFTTTAADLPAPLAVDTTYFLINENATNKEYKVATTYENAGDGTAIDITDTGTGTHTGATITLNTPLYGTVDSDGKSYISDNNGNVWRITAQIELLTGNDHNSSDGLVAWKGYLFNFNGTDINTFNISTGTWTNSWQSITSSTFHNRAIVGRDDRIYFCNKHGIGSILEKEGQTFDPASGATYTYTALALELPDSDDTKWISELGSNLMIATNRGRVYPWDRVSDSFDVPIQMSEDIDIMIDVNNLLYIAGGTKGNIYVTNGTTTQKINQLPSFLNNNSAYFRDVSKTEAEIIFAVDNQGVGDDLFGGVWALDTNTNSLILKNKVSSSDGYNVNSINVILSANTTSAFYVAHGYEDDGMIDIYNSSRYYENNEAIITSQYYTVGTKYFPRTIEKLEVEFTDTLGTVDDFAVYYRTNLGDSWTLIASDSGDATPITKLYEYPLSLDVENIQIKITMDSSNFATAAFTPLKEIRIT